MIIILNEVHALHGTIVYFLLPFRALARVRGLLALDGGGVAASASPPSTAARDLRRAGVFFAGVSSAAALGWPVLLRLLAGNTEVQQRL